MVLAPPMMVHFAHKGSTNHDDADLFVGLLLLLLLVTPRSARARDLTSFSVGLLAGLAGAWLLDGGLRAAAVVAAAWFVGPRPELRQLVAVGLGLVLTVGAAATVGVDLGSSSAIVDAFFDPEEEEEESLEHGSGSKLGDRIGALISDGLQASFEVSTGDAYGIAPLPRGPRRWGYLALTAVMILIGGLLSPGRPRGPPGREDAHRPGRVVVWACVAAIAAQLAAVTASNVGLEPDYIVPIWPYLVLLCARAFAPARAGRRGLVVGGAAVAWAAWGAALLLCLGGPWQNLVRFWSPGSETSEDPERASARQASFARSLSAGRPTRHPLGRRIVERLDTTALADLAAARPEEAPAFVRLLRWDAARQLVDGACAENGVALPQLDRGVPPGGQAIFWEGVGEALARWPEPCSAPLAAAPVGAEPLQAAVRQQVEGDDLLWRALVTGIAQGRLDERNGDFQGLDEDFADDPARELFCVAAGRWAFLTMRPVELEQWLEVTPVCHAAELAVGWGIGLARDRPPTAATPPPRLVWWQHDADEPSVRAFDCAWEREDRQVRALVAGIAVADPPADQACLPSR